MSSFQGFCDLLTPPSSLHLYGLDTNLCKIISIPSGCTDSNSSHFKIDFSKTDRNLSNSRNQETKIKLSALTDQATPVKKSSSPLPGPYPGSEQVPPPLLPLQKPALPMARVLTQASCHWEETSLKGWTLLQPFSLLCCVFLKWFSISLSRLCMCMHIHTRTHTPTALI